MTNQIPRGPDNLVCPFHKKYMSKVCHTCPMWVQIRGKNPQSTEIVDKWNCAIAWAPILAIETTQMVRSTGVAIESFRNEVVARSAAPIHDTNATRLPTGEEYEDRYLPMKTTKGLLVSK